MRRYHLIFSLRTIVSKAGEVAAELVSGQMPGPERDHLVQQLLAVEIQRLMALASSISSV
ncbi:hypothetical protein KAU04_08825 [bacterium]|nr:hypothetical protein [bacterium]